MGSRSWIHSVPILAKADPMEFRKLLGGGPREWAGTLLFIDWDRGRQRKLGRCDCTAGTGWTQATLRSPRSP